jgi:alpha-1,2-mannosyltransferase
MGVQPRVLGLAHNGWVKVEPLVCGVLPVVSVTLLLVVAAQRNNYAVDFHSHFWPAAYQVLHGHSPFPGPHATITLGSFIYPAFAAVVLVPFATVSREVADPLFTVLIAAALFGILRVLRIRDWRCYGIALLWPPVFHALQTANFTMLVALGLAVLWRVRDRAILSGLILGLLMAVKVFLWPLVIWLLVAKRYRAAASSIAFAAVISLAAWGVAGFSELSYYPRMVLEFDRISAPATYTLVGFATKAGLSHGVAQAIAWAVGLAALAATVKITRREGLSPRSFGAAIVAVILLSPIVWLHYFTFLLVPLALLRPRFGPLWLLPLLAWPLPVGPAGPSLLSLPLLAGGALLIAVASRQADGPTATSAVRPAALAPAATAGSG